MGGKKYENVCNIIICSSTETETRDNIAAFLFRTVFRGHFPDENNNPTSQRLLKNMQ